MSMHPDNARYSAMSGRLWAARDTGWPRLVSAQTHDGPVDLTACLRDKPVAADGRGQGTRFLAELAPAEIVPPSLPPGDRQSAVAGIVPGSPALSSRGPVNPQHARARGR